MIRGLLVPGIGAVLLANVRLAAPVDRYGHVLFVVDTGSERTILMPADIERLGIGAKLLAGATNQWTSRGVGGSTPASIWPGSLSFLHNDDRRSTFDLGLAVVSDSQSLDLPSILAGTSCSAGSSA